ncbi:MAG TPA: hypothetical protein VIM11_10755 [Tepidisphaeraceae bacterium]|jgi:hypothetical protein
MAMHVHHAFAGGGENEGEGEIERTKAMDAMSDMLGPGQVDQAIGQAIQMCWMSLPSERRTVAEVEKQIRRLVDRAIANLHEDAQAFGRGG